MVDAGAGLRNARLYFFTVGGADSHDIEGGILKYEGPNFVEQYWMPRGMDARFQVNGHSWGGKQELTNAAEHEEINLSPERVSYEVDYIVTDGASSSIADTLGNRGFTHDLLTDFLKTYGKKLNSTTGCSGATIKKL